jgi:hypothetical protein
MGINRKRLEQFLPFFCLTENELTKVLLLVLK